MSKSVDLPDTVFAALEAAAATTGMTPAEWVATRLAGPTSPASGPRPAKVPRPRWDEFAGRIGTVGNGLEDPNAEGMATRRRAGRPRTHRVSALVCAVDLPDPVYVTLEDVAHAMDTTPAGWIAAQVPAPLAPPEGDGQHRTLAEQLEGRVGTFRSGRGASADRHSELFTKGLAEKKAGWIAAGRPDSGSASDVPDDGNPPATLAERLEGLVGTVSLERSDVAEHHGELFAEGMAETYRQGRL